MINLLEKYVKMEEGKLSIIFSCFLFLTLFAFNIHFIKQILSTVVAFLVVWRVCLVDVLYFNLRKTLF